jgi:Ice-binding-like
MLRAYFPSAPTRLAFLLSFAALFYLPLHVSAAGAGPSLGAASGFAALAGGPAAGAVTCTSSTVAGSVGVVRPGTFVSTNCTVAAVNTNATAAYADFLNAYDALQFTTQCDQTLTGTLAGVTLSPGVYCFPAAATLTGTLTLDGPADGVWIFKIGTGGTGALTATNFSVVMPGNPAGACPNVYWWVAQDTTLTGSNFVGAVLAGADITVTGGTFVGEALAGGAGSATVPTGAVTLTNSSIRACAPAGGHVDHDKDHGNRDKDKKKCNQGVGNGPEGCDPGNSDHHNPSNDELGGTPGNPGRKKS